MKKLLFLLMFFTSLALNSSFPTPECSKFRESFILGLKSKLLSDTSKLAHLRNAVLSGDYCAAKYWLDAGVKLEKAFERDYKNSNPFTITLNIATGNIRLWPSFFVKYVSEEKMLPLLKQYGVEGFRYTK